MNASEAAKAETVAKHVSVFNDEVVAKQVYHRRRSVLTTPVVFFDADGEDLPLFRSSRLGWCTIPADLSVFFQRSYTGAHVLSFDGPEESKSISDPEFLREYHREIPVILRNVAALYLGLHWQAANDYDHPVRLRVRERISELRELVYADSPEITRKPSAVTYLGKEIKRARLGREPVPRPVPQAQARNARIQRVLNLRRESARTVNEICALCRISRTTYYLICSREDKHEWANIRPRGRQFTENSLRLEEKREVQQMADNPDRNYNVPEMCARLTQRFHRTISYSKVRSYLTKELKYSYKRNAYKPACAFGPNQAITKFKVCRLLLAYMHEGRSVIFIDEAGFAVGMHAEYSYAQRGQRPFRIRRTRSKLLNLIMGVTSERVFCYQVRKGLNNEHSFLSFLIELYRKLQQLGPDHLSKTVLFLDNASFHKSALSMKFLKLLPFPVLFNAPGSPELNPIELVFGEIKRRLKKAPSVNL